MSETSERFDIRLPANAKQLLIQAAEISGNTLTGLVLNAALDRARDILQTHQHFRLNAQDWQRFLDALDQPPAPNEALRSAWRDARNADPE